MSEEIVMEQPALTQSERVMNTFAAPSMTFRDIKRSQSWWLPFLLVAIFSYALSGSVMKKVGVDSLTEHAMQQRAEKTGQAPPPAAKALTATIFKVSLAMWPLFYLIFASFAALLLWLGFNFILGGTAKYAEMFAVYIFASLPALIKSVLTIAVVIFGSNENFDIENSVGTNLGYYLGPDAAHWLKSLLTSLDVFSIWILALSALGAAIVARVKVKNGMLLVFGAWILFILVKAGLAAL